MPERGGVVDVVIRAKDLTGRALASFQRRWRATTRVVKDAARAVTAFTVAAGAALVGLTKLGQEGARVGAVKAAFARTTDDATAALARLREASRGTVDDFKLMALSNQALALGAARTTDEFADQIEAVRRVARAQGLAVEEGLEKFVTGMARLSKLRLDDLGIQVDQEKANERLAKQLGRQVSSLTDAEKATAFRNEAMRQLVALSEDLAGKENVGAEAGDRFATAMVNAKNQVVELVAQSPQVAAFFDALTDGVAGVTDAIAQQDWGALAEIFRAVGSLLGDALVFGMKKSIESLPESTSFDRNIEGLMRFMGIDIDRIKEWWRENFVTQRDIFDFGTFADATAGSRADLDAVLARLAAGRGSGAPGADRSRIGGGTGAAPADVFGLPGVTGPALPTSPFGHTTRGRIVRPGAFAPTGGVQMPPVRPLVPGSGVDLEGAADEFARAGQVAVAAMGSTAAAIIAGSDQIEASIVNMVTSILRELPGVGGLGGALIGAVGGIFGALFSRGGRRDPVPVRMTDIDDQAARKLRESSREPLRIVTIIEQAGVEIDRIERELIDRQNRQEVVRFGNSGSPVGRRT